MVVSKIFKRKQIVATSAENYKAQRYDKHLAEKKEEKASEIYPQTVEHLMSKKGGNYSLKDASDVTLFLKQVHGNTMFRSLDAFKKKIEKIDLKSVIKNLNSQSFSKLNNTNKKTNKKYSNDVRIIVDE
tara:strand:- start:41 stop:427 length:387 start_codon:yes stop_codon:yes gene_type:complete